MTFTAQLWLPNPAEGKITRIYCFSSQSVSKDNSEFKIKIWSP